MDESLCDLLEFIRFAEGVSAKIHGLLDEAGIYRAVVEGVPHSKGYAASILLLVDEGSKLRIAEASLPFGALESAGDTDGNCLRDFSIDLERSNLWRKVAGEGETIQVTLGDIIDELRSQSLANRVSEAEGYGKTLCLLTPLKRRGEIIGAFAISSPTLTGHFIPLVQSLAQHISVALERAAENVERRCAEEALRRWVEENVASRRLLLALSRAAQAVLRAHTAADVYRRVGDEMTKLGYQVVIFTLAGDREHLTVSHLAFPPVLIQASEELTGLSACGYRFPLQPGGFFHRIITEKKAIFTQPAAYEVAEALPESVRPMAGQLMALLGVQRSVVIPLIVNGESYGVFVIFGADLTEADLPAMGAFADQAAIAIENTHLYQCARKGSDQLSRILVSHELRSPLTNIKAAAQTWGSLMSDDDDLKREAADILVRESDRLAWLLERIIAVITLENGMTVPDWREINLRSLLLKTADTGWLSEHDHRLEVLVKDELVVRADEDWTVMAIRSLLENAIKHCPAESHIELRGSKLDEGWAQITVADNGPGIASSELERIFEKFYRERGAIESGVLGHGLGLYLVKLLAEAQGGMVWVESEEGKGTTFGFSLSLVD